MSILLKLIITFTFIASIIVGFYKFMTYDRSYNWVKQLQYETESLTKVHDFRLKEISNIEVKNIKLPNERLLKIKIQKLLSFFNLMNYGQEFGKSLKYTSKDNSEIIIIKAWCMNDHVIGIEIELLNIDETKSQNIKNKFTAYFFNYTIIWTHKPS